MAIHEMPSPNHGPRTAGAAVDILLLHYTGMTSAAAALERLCDPHAEVSAHYVVDEDGATFRLVPEDRRAWHAGVSLWAGERDINSRSIGIEIVNPGHEHGYRPFPAAQMQAVERLCGEIVRRHPIPPYRVLAHSDVAPARKEDPGELFDWERLASAGIGLWPTVEPVDRALMSDPASAAGLLRRFGYGLDRCSLSEAVTAFHRHFRPRTLSGTADAETMARLNALLRVSGL